MSTPSRGKWIWYADPGYDIINSWMQARHVFELAAVPKKAVVNVTADARYRLYVNGTYVCRGPARGYQVSWPYDTVDIAAYLKPGRNVIAALVHQFGISTFQYLHQGYAGFLLWGSAGTVDVSSGDAWRTRPAPGFVHHTTRLSLQLGFQEFFDSRLDDDSWTSLSYDDAAWKGPGWARIAGVMPWHALEERGIPMLAEKTITPQVVVSEAVGECSPGCSVSLDVVTLFVEEKLSWQTTRVDMRQSPEYATITMDATGTGSYRALCIDFGKEVVGSIRLRIDGAAGGEIVDTAVCEGLDGLAPVIETRANGPCNAAFGNRLFARPGTTEHEQFDMFGFRYLILIVRNSTSPLTIGLGLRWVGYPMDIRSRFDSSDAMLNRIYEISAWTQQSCMLDAYVDCPWREQAQWWGDARVQGKNTFYLSADARLLARGIRQIAGQELPNGLTYGHAPTMSHNCILPDFTLTWILTNWDYYWQTGDIVLFESMRDRAHRALAYFESMRAPNGLLPYDHRYWLFLDWADIFRDGYPAVYNLFYLMALRVAVKLYALCGDAKSARLYRGREEALLKAIMSQLVDVKHVEILGGRDWKNKPVHKNAPHAYALAILLDIMPEHHAEFAEKYLMPFVRDNKTDGIITSSFYSFYLFEALKKLGFGEEVVGCIRRRWGRYVEAGLTATPEGWSTQPNVQSLCHAWSAHPIVHLSNVSLGVWQESAGWTKIRYAPAFVGMDGVRGKVAVPQGVIESSWQRSGGQMSAELTLPAGVTAVVQIPGVKRQTVTGKGRWRFEVAA